MLIIFTLLLFCCIVKNQPQHLIKQTKNQEGNQNKTFNFQDQIPSTSADGFVQFSNLLSPSYDKGLIVGNQIDFSILEEQRFNLEQKQQENGFFEEIQLKELSLDAEQQINIDEELSELEKVIEQLNQQTEQFQQQSQIQSKSNSFLQILEARTPIDSSSVRIASTLQQQNVESGTKRKIDSIITTEQQQKEKSNTKKQRRKNQKAILSDQSQTENFESCRSSSSDIIFIHSSSSDNQETSPHQKQDSNVQQTPIQQQIVQTSVTTQRKRITKKKNVDPQSQIQKKIKQIKLIRISQNKEQNEKLFRSFQRKLKSIKKQVAFQKSEMKKQKYLAVKLDMKSKIKEKMNYYELVQQKMKQIKAMQQWLLDQTKFKPDFLQQYVPLQQQQKQLPSTSRQWPKIRKYRQQLIQKCVNLNGADYITETPSWVIAQQNYATMGQILYQPGQHQFIQHLPRLTSTQADILALKLVICKLNLKRDYQRKRDHHKQQLRLKSQRLFQKEKKELEELRKQFFGQKYKNILHAARIRVKIIRRLNIIDQPPTEEEQQTLRSLINQAAEIVDIQILQEPLSPQVLYQVLKVVREIHLE